jgi:hypothetical protein
LAYQPQVSSTFLSKQISQQLGSSIFLSEQISTNHQPPAKRTWVGGMKTLKPKITFTGIRFQMISIFKFEFSISLIHTLVVIE